MKIEAITTCVGESSRKMLRFTAFANSLVFDNFIVVTSPEDIETQKLCETYRLGKTNISCVITDAFQKYGFSFNKGAAINEGIKKLKYNDWICHIDSDIRLYWNLPDKQRKSLEKELDDAEFFYGSRRVIIPQSKDLIDLNYGVKQETDFTIYPGIGYGYHQIWNMQSSIVKSGARYPEIYEKGDSDWKWRNLWGDCIKGDWEYTGKLKRISANVLHLGLPDISGAEEFWKE